MCDSDPRTPPRGAKTLDGQVERLVAIVAATLDELADGETLAGMACLSRFHFQRAFRTAMGETPGALRRRVLLERAAWSLHETRTAVTEVALDAGYESLEGFSRAFRRAFGVSPSHFRRLAPGRYRLQSPSGVHYDPAARAPRRSHPRGDIGMDLTDRLIDHDAWLTRRMLQAARQLTDEQLDRPLPSPEQPLPFESPESTLRTTLARLVFTKEVWVAAVRGHEIDENPDNSVSGLLARFDTAFAEFRRIVSEVRADDRWDDNFVDALCVPVETFTYGGMIAHVITFAACRRTTAIKAFAALGLDDLGYGDPMDWERAVAAQPA